MNRALKFNGEYGGGRSKVRVGPTFASGRTLIYVFCLYPDWWRGDVEVASQSAGVPILGRYTRFVVDPHTNCGALRLVNGLRNQLVPVDTPTKTCYLLTIVLAALYTVHTSNTIVAFSLLSHLHASPEIKPFRSSSQEYWTPPERLRMRMRPDRCTFNRTSASCRQRCSCAFQHCPSSERMVSERR